jgi:hypothetical protein
MKAIKLFPILLLFILGVALLRVYSDYDKNTDFKQYKTYAFYKNGIDKVNIRV